MKACKICGKEKGLSEFPKNGKHRGGNTSYRPDCKQCHSEYKKKKYAEDGFTADKQKQQKRERYANDDEYRSSKLRYHKRYGRNRWKTDPEFREWNNKRNAEWRKTPKGRILNSVCCSKRRARVLGANSPSNVSELEKEFRSNMKECSECGTTEDLTLDHIVALSNGGDHSPDNWDCLCGGCNSSKGNRR